MNLYSNMQANYSMKNIAFNIEFVTSEIRTKNLRTTQEYKYHAVITTISKSFKLFKVSKIQRITETGPITLASSYYLTSYPLVDRRDDTWKDPITFCSNNFLQVIGNTIESHLANSMTNKAN